ncbi:hypothetical protein AVEN_74948-1 [Araneus ventricosus]|uniref:Uncharacterized protein n=1 Tax=Araneus ventricosus TaxID=182803 RepID=A0A4Y2IZX4_ARAVE|nr:hypothetical protein AVEN_74948-1 [Araneus ventricosus]
MRCVYGAQFMRDGIVPEFYRKFKDGRTDVPVEDEQRWNSASSEDLFLRFDQMFRERDEDDFHLFAELKIGLGGQHFCTNEELQSSVETNLSMLAPTFYIGILVRR